MSYTPSGGGELAENIPQRTNQYVWIETEQPTTITTPLQIANDTSASQGRFIYAPNGSGSQWSATNKMATYTVNITEAGEYLLYGRVNAANGDDNSFYIQVDNGVNALWDTAFGNGWQWQQVVDRDNPVQLRFNLSVGTHTIKIKLREDGTKIDKLLLTNDLNFTPTGTGS